MRIAAFLLSITLSLTLAGTAHAACSWTTLYNNTTADAVQVMNNFDCVEPIRSAGGNVGIGVSSPVYTLDVHSGASGTALQLSSSAANWGIRFAGGQGWIGFGDFPVNGAPASYLGVAAGTGGGLTFGTNGGIERMRIAPGGNVGVGSTNPTLGHLQIDGSGNQILSINSSDDDSTIRLYRAGGMKWRIYNNGANDHLFILDADQDNGVVLYQNANSWASASDARLKRNARSLPVLARLSNYRAVSFDWRSDGRHDIGVIAQELEKSFPELVRRGGSGTLKNHQLDQSGIWSVDYSKLGAVALAGVKELNQKVEALSVVNERAADTQADLNDLRRLVQRQADEIRELRSRITRMEQVRVRTAAR